jgi:tRNA dimethylallyltransferase
MSNKLIVILGPTATGKTHFAVNYAIKHNGEIISADSRQVYRGLDIGTGKDLAEYNVNGKVVQHHLIDIIEPTKDYSVFQFQKDFYHAYHSIIERDKTPILCGGTGLYIESILLGYDMVEVQPNHELRAKLAVLQKSELEGMLINLNPKLHNSTDLTSKKRIIRAIEIAMAKNISNHTQHKIPEYTVYGISFDREVVRERITNRLKYRLQNGMIEEVEALIKSGLSCERLDYLGLEYRYLGQFLQKEITYNDMFQRLNSAIHQFAKRQITFFRRMQKREIEINWI